MKQSANNKEHDLKALALKIAAEVSIGGGIEEDAPLMESS